MGWPHVWCLTSDFLIFSLSFPFSHSSHWKVKTSQISSLWVGMFPKLYLLATTIDLLPLFCPRGLLPVCKSWYPQESLVWAMNFLSDSVGVLPIIFTFNIWTKSGVGVCPAKQADAYNPTKEFPGQFSNKLIILFRNFQKKKKIQRMTFCYK